MASLEAQHESDDGMDEFMDKFKTQRYKNAFSEDNWEEVSASHYYPVYQRHFYVITLLS